MAHRKYSDHQITSAADLREQGQSIDKIAQRVGMSASSVYWHCLRLGADSPRAKGMPRNVGNMVVKRGNHVVRRFTPEEDRQIVQMEADGCRLSEIARKLGRRRNSILGRLMTLARHEARAEEAAA